MPEWVLIYGVHTNISRTDQSYGSLDTVYGPPHECKGTLRTKGAVCVYVFGLQMEIILLATMSSARACSN